MTFQFFFLTEVHLWRKQKSRMNDGILHFTPVVKRWDFFPSVSPPNHRHSKDEWHTLHLNKLHLPLDALKSMYKNRGTNLKSEGHCLLQISKKSIQPKSNRLNHAHNTTERLLIFFCFIRQIRILIHDLYAQWSKSYVLHNCLKIVGHVRSLIKDRIVDRIDLRPNVHIG